MHACAIANGALLAACLKMCARHLQLAPNSCRSPWSAAWRLWRQPSSPTCCSGRSPSTSSTSPSTAPPRGAQAGRQARKWWCCCRGGPVGLALKVLCAVHTGRPQLDRHLPPLHGRLARLRGERGTRRGWVHLGLEGVSAAAAAAGHGGHGARHDVPAARETLSGAPPAAQRFLLLYPKNAAPLRGIRGRRPPVTQLHKGTRERSVEPLLLVLRMRRSSRPSRSSSRRRSSRARGWAKTPTCRQVGQP